MLDAAWHDFVAKGRDLVVTSGMVSTDQQKHALSRIPDSVEFSLDVRSQDRNMLEAMHALVLQHVTRIENERAVRSISARRCGPVRRSAASRRSPG
ncbi:hypothetical protein [Neorhizobium sp. T25_13]|uniref:hypothetical protein n=1 Tax=Neorhizobium sp. T25_13 TaxID=2093830 RepID=UPI00197BA770|nr:hypothetical protein [Neorhizobium sp. T25_13]